MYSINVLVITYNQQDVIGRALDSILQQREYGLHEIIIGDDCSSDNNWNVIQEYAVKYPEHIRAYRNDHNKGIYGNMEYVLSMRGNADLYLELSGDDALCDGYFKAVQAFAELHRYEIDGNAAVIYGDYQDICLDGKVSIHRNDKILYPQDAISLKIRQLICGRSSLVTPQVYERYRPVDLTKGLCLAEELYDCQKQLCSDINLYLPFVGSIYYSGIGVSTTMKSLKYYNERIYKFVHLPEYMKLNETDIAYTRYCYYFNKFMVTRHIIDIVKCIWFLNKGKISGCGNTMCNDIRRILHCAIKSSRPT